MKADRINAIDVLEQCAPSAGDDSASLRDLMGLLALPALWAGKDEKTILRVMADAVCSIMPIAVIYARIRLPPELGVTPVFRVGRMPMQPLIPGPWLDFTELCDQQAGRSIRAESPEGPLEVLRFQMSAGPSSESIWFGLKAGLQPTANRMAFLHAAVSLCTTGFNTARIDYQRTTAIRAKDEFLAMLGHELRNPLAPIVTTLALIRLKGSGHLAKEHALIERQVGHLSRLVDDLLDVTRITRGAIDLRLEVFDLRAVALDAIESVGPLMAEMRHRISADVGQLETWVNGDPQRIRQVLVNLLVNAAKYTLPGGAIAFTASQDAGRVSLSIQDNGSGIDPELLPRVFDLFEQGATTIDRSRGGLGIGLAIVKKLVGLHAGTVTARSEGRGLGATFTVTLPLFHPAIAALPVQPAIAAPGDTDADVEAAPRLPGRRVLVVDDNVDALDTMEAVLAFHGFEILTARHPDEALEKAPAFGADAYVLDIGLPGMDGYRLADELRRLGGDEVRAARFVALTGYGQDADKARSLSAGFDRHLVKPVQIDDLLAALQAQPALVATAS